MSFKLSMGTDLSDVARKEVFYGDVVTHAYGAQLGVRRARELNGIHVEEICMSGRIQNSAIDILNFTLVLRTLRIDPICDPAHTVLAAWSFILPPSWASRWDEEMGNEQGSTGHRNRNFDSIYNLLRLQPVERQRNLMRR